VITELQFEALLMGVARARDSVRSQAIIMVMFWRGPRVTELCQLKTNDPDIQNGRLFVRRTHNGLNTTHPVRQDVLRIRKRYLRQPGEAVFTFARIRT
jgi:integrase